MKRSLLFCLLGSMLFADDSGIQYLELGKPHYVIGDKARVRVEVDLKAEVVAELPIGTEVVPTEQIEHQTIINGVDAPWYRVKFTHKGAAKEGFIWGNLIAKGAAKSKDGLIFMFGTGRKQKDLSVGTEFTSQFRVAKHGKELAKLEIKEGVDFKSKQNITLTGGRGLDGVQNIFSVEFLQEYCGGKGNTMFIFWTGEKLIHAHSSSEGSDAPYYATEQQVFPADKGGVKAHVVVMTESGNHDDKKSVKKEKFKLRWNRKKLEKPK
jgi:hypothetical protein